MDYVRVVSLAVLTCFLCVDFSTCLWPAFPSNSEVTRSVTTRPRAGDVSFNTAGTKSLTTSCACNDDIDLLESTLRGEHARLEIMQRRMDELASQMYNVQNTLTGLPARNGAQNYDIAFSARVGSNRPYLSNIDTIIFDEIIINNGGAYDPYSGKFISPTPGVYQFSCTILSGYNTTIETMFTVNGSESGRIYSGAYKNRGSGSNTVLLNLKEGDEVSVNLFYGNGNYVHGQWSAFSGHLVSQYV